ncbi:MAG: uroporphyrinogen-III synthase, partial [Thermoplasmata archaeon]
MTYLLTTRPAEKFKSISGKCFDILNCPLTEIKPMDIDYKKLIEKYSVKYIVFTSSVGADLFFKEIKDYPAEYMAIGDKTAEIVRRNGYECVVPEEKDSMGLGMEML